MGVLPLEFLEGDTRQKLNLEGKEKISIQGINKLSPRKILDCNIASADKNTTIQLLCRIDTLKELDYYKSGGILQYVLNSIVDKAS